MYANYVNGLVIKGLDVRWESALPAYFTNAIYCEHFSNLLIDDFSGTAGPNAAAREAVIALHHGRSVNLSNLKTIGNQSATTHKQVLRDDVTSAVPGGR